MAKAAKAKPAQSTSTKQKAGLVKKGQVKNAAKTKKLEGASGNPGAAGKNQEPWFSFFAGSNNKEYQAYMRNEWGWEKRGDVALFEKLCLEGQQAGLSWATVLAKRAAYRKAFNNFNIAKCAALSEKDVDRILKSASSGPGGRDAVICHRGKLLSIPHNARCVVALRSAPYIDPKTGAACRTLDDLLWSFVGGKPILNNWPSKKSIPTVTPTAEAMSKALKKLGFSFVGATICYSLMQSCGLVIDHPKGTPEHRAAAARLARRRRGSR